ncbi:MAG: hypothetical protein IPK26_13570 [Planctomycetes bacterium]|nr:hypothetical protein [Planctomycetota bacterium]
MPIDVVLPFLAVQADDQVYRGESLPNVTTLIGTPVHNAGTGVRSGDRDGAAPATSPASRCTDRRQARVESDLDDLRVGLADRQIRAPPARTVRR